MKFRPTLQTFFFMLVCMSVGVVHLVASSPVEIEKVNFEKVGENDWVRCRSVLKANSMGNGGSLNSRFVDDLHVVVYLSYKRGNSNFECYKAEVEVVSIEVGQRYYLDFFLPAIVIRRGNLTPQPFAFLFALEVSGHLVPLTRNMSSKNLYSNDVAQQAIKDQYVAQLDKNAGVLLPSYLAPFSLTVESVDQYPIFKRIEG